MGELLGIEFTTRTLIIIGIFAFLLLFVILFLDQIVDMMNQLKTDIIESGEEADGLVG